jgi:hypothetical protein
MSEAEQGDLIWEHMNSRCGPSCPYCRIAELEAENAKLRQALQKIVDNTPANEHKKWPHHHFYLVTAKAALEAE